MRLLWAIDTQYDTSCGNDYNHIIDCDNTVFIPFRGSKQDGKISISYIQIDKKTGSQLGALPQRTETFDLFPNIFYSQNIYNVGNKTIKYKSEHYIECLENEKVIWTFRHWAYLYTDIVEKDGYIIFGTDGMGSRLYCLDAQSGKLLSETRTHFSGFYDYSGFNWYKDNLVVYGKGTLTVINPFTGEIMNEHKISSKYPYRSFLQVLNGYAYCCVTTNCNQPTILCFKL